MILADTSAWVEFDRGTDSAVCRRVEELIGDDGPLVVSQPILMEVLAGAQTVAAERDLRRLLLRQPMLDCDAIVDFESAASIYRRCRRAGVTPRGMIDCMIVAVAWRRGATILARDVDLDRVASVIGVDMDPGSLR